MTSERDPEPAREDVVEAFADLLSLAGRSTFLLLALLSMLIAYPFLDGTTDQRLLLGALSSAILVAAAFAAGRSRRALMISFAFAGPTLVLKWWFILGGIPLAADLSLLMFVIFCGFTIAHVLGYVLGPGAVTADKLHAALSAYILTAMLWGALYALVDRLLPGSFLVDGVPSDTHPLGPKDFLFFSFTTLTTTGYGRIVPIIHHAQSISILEQLAGTFFVAILIARLAGLYQPGAKRRKRSRDEGR